MLTYTLHHGCSSRPVLRLVPDESGLYRIEWPDIALSDLANLTRCKQAGLEWAQTQVMTDQGKRSGARRLNSLKNFSWSASYSDLNQPTHANRPETPLEAAA
jgi:hypothetical protein